MAFRKIFLALLFVVSSCSSFAEKLVGETILNSLATSLPVGWESRVVRDPAQPNWTEHVTPYLLQVHLIGTRKAGYNYTLISGESKKIFFLNEAIVLWIVPSSFDDGWSLGRRMANRLKMSPIEIPHVVYSDLNIKIYGIESWLTSESSPGVNLKDQTPPGTVKARTVYSVPTGSWESWRHDVEVFFSAALR